MKLFFVLALIIVVGCLPESDYLFAFKQYQTQFNKQYQPEEIAFRYFNFKKTLDFIRDHNSKNTQFKVGLNHLSDLSRDEYLSILTPMNFENIPPSPPYQSNIDAPDSWDWRQKGAVSSVKDQGMCGSCWAFSTAGMVEGCLVVSGGPLQDVSEQELVDCATPYGCYGCRGCWPENAMKYAEDKTKPALCGEEYTYTARDGTCKDTQYKGITRLNGHAFSTLKDETALLDACYTKGPISVCIDASHGSFQNYHSGVYYEPACNPNFLDHAVLLVGWGVDNGDKYWIVKNSWSDTWGNKGYIWMSRDRDNNCGIASHPLYGTSCAVE
jgi:cathepsin L